MQKIWQRVVKAYIFRPPTFLIPGGTLLGLFIGFFALSAFRSKPNPLLQNCRPVQTDIVGADACESPLPLAVVRATAEEWAKDSGLTLTSPDPNRVVLTGQKETFEVIGGRLMGEGEVAYNTHGPTTIVTHHALNWKERATERVKDAAIR